MCDTIVATPEATVDGRMWFGKNSDRHPNEAHEIIQLPAQDYPVGSRVKMTYVEIDQAAHTHAVLLAKPFWIWGAEMGCNEYGVAIGNEAVFTKVPYAKEDGVIGMDLLRLGLERGASAVEALKVMTELLERHGQGGNCGFGEPFHYHNSFIVADPKEAWVLETAGVHWAARRITGVYSISNGLGLGNEWDLASADLVTYAVKRGWCKGRDDFDFSRCYSDPLYTRFSQCRLRSQQTRERLQAGYGRLGAADLMATLRQHGTGDAWKPSSGLLGVNVCMHAGFGPVRHDQTTGSMVSRLEPGSTLHFLTGTAAPCTSLFKPMWQDAALPDMGPRPVGKYDPATLFWRHESLHRLTLQDYSALAPLYQEERDKLELDFIARALAADAPAGQRAELAAACMAEASQAEAGWLQLVARQAPGKYPGWLYGKTWKAINNRAQMPVINEIIQLQEA